jgi:hypothetical protein
LEDMLGEEVTSFAYPFGKPRIHFTTATRNILAEAGFDYAASLHCLRCNKASDPLAMPRFAMRGGVNELARFAEGSLSFVGLYQQWIPLNLARQISPFDFKLKKFYH